MRFSSEMSIHLKTFFNRIVHTRCTLLFFFVTVTFCFIQGLVQAFLYSVDQDYSSLVEHILEAGEIQIGHNFSYLTRHSDSYNLQLCSNLPNQKGKGNCHVVFDTRDVLGVAEYTPFLSNVTSFSHGATSVIANLTLNKTENAVTMFLPDNVTKKLHVDKCLGVLGYPDQVLNNAKREELALIGSQFWLLFTGVYALGTESVPHMLAALFVRVVATAWTAYAIWRTTDVDKRFTALTTSPATCDFAFFPDYLRRRQNYEVPDLVLNITALVVCSILTLKLVKSYQSKTLARIGTTEEIQTIYRFFMAVLACLQVLVYFMLTSLALWLDQVLHGALSHIATVKSIYLAQSITEIVLLLPWIALGWWAITHENRLAIAGFIAWALCMVVMTALDFYSVGFRWTFVQWPFFGGVTTASFIVLILAAGFAGVCTARFGRGFANYLYAERLLAQTDFAPDSFVISPSSERDMEKNPLPWDLDIKPSAPEPQGQSSPQSALPTYLRPFGQ